MTTIAQDTFDGRTVSGNWGTASDGQTWNRLVGSGALNVSGGVGTGSGGATSNVLTIGSASATDVDITVDVTQGSTGDILGPLARCVDSSNFYYLDIGAYSGFLTFGKRVAGTFNDLILQAFTYNTTSTYRLRLKITGSTVQAKAWLTTDTEPASWMISTTDTSFTTGPVGMFVYCPDATAIQVDNFLATDGQTVINLVGQTRANFLVKSPLTVMSRADFLSRSALGGQARAHFMQSLLYSTRSIAHFIIDSVIAGPKELSSLFKTLSKLIPAFKTLQHISTTFKTRPHMAYPNSTVKTTATVTDDAGTLQTNLTTVSVTVSFPDGSSSSFSLGNGVTNMGSGQYLLSYSTKTPGLCVEEWRVTSADGSVADFKNNVPVSY